MEATKVQIASIFNGHRILEVPFYQRSYVWQKEQWSRFLEDMEFISHCKQDYFLGSVILKQQMTEMGEANDRRTIIDGQQRFTTLAIFFKVLCLKTNDMDTFNQHFSVRNKKRNTKDFALIHSINDRKDFEKVLQLSDDEELDAVNASNIIKAHDFFRKNIDVEKVDINVLLSHIVFIGIELQQQDDEQVIFDTINSLGVRLTTGELLKNYFFNEGSREEYEELWMPIFEKDRDVVSYWDSQVTTGRIKRSNIDAFFSAFLNIKIQDPKISVDTEHKAIYRRAEGIFGNYKDLISTYGLNKKDFVWEVVEYAELYFNNIDPNISKSELPGKPCIERINFLISILDCSTMVPYILFLLRNVKSEKERNDMFGYLESYIVRRQICKSENNSFSDLFNESLIANRVLTLESLKDYIENKGDYQALSLPNDERVRESLKNIDHPNKRALAILYLMETRLRIGKPHATKLYAFDGYSLEHLMPKKWEKNWPMSSGYDEDARKFLINTLGNMAMLPSKLNSSISNATWDVKKNGKKNQQGLIAYASDLETLKEVINKKEWSEDYILDRADWMANVAINVWPSYLPGVEDYDFSDFEVPSPLSEPDYTVSDEKEITQKKRNNNHDNTKYSIEGSDFLSKSEFVLMVVRKYVQKYPECTYKQLKAKFSDKLCASGFKFIGFLCTEEEYDAWDNKNKEKRYLPTKPNRRLLSNDEIAFFVNTQWTQESMKKIVKIAKEEGWEVNTQNKL